MGLKKGRVLFFYWQNNTDYCSLVAGTYNFYLSVTS